MLYYFTLCTWNVKRRQAEKLLGIDFHMNTFSLTFSTEDKVERVFVWLMWFTHFAIKC